MNKLGRVAVLLTVALGVLVPLAPASAGADPIGGVIVIPGSGNDLNEIRVRTSAGCPAKADAFYAKMKGHDFPPDGQLVTANTSAGLSHSFGFDVYFLLVMRDYAKDNHTTLGGRYDIAVFCVDSVTLQSYGGFTGSLEFTSPSHYEAIGAAKPTGTPPPPLAQAPDGSAAAPETVPSPAGTLSGPRPTKGPAQNPVVPAPTAEAPSGVDPPSPSAVGQRTSEPNDATGQGVAWLIAPGAVLVAGTVIAVANRMRKRRS